LKFPVLSIVQSLKGKGIKEHPFPKQLAINFAQLSVITNFKPVPSNSFYLAVKKWSMYEPYWYNMGCV